MVEQERLYSFYPIRTASKPLLYISSTIIIGSAIAIRAIKGLRNSRISGVRLGGGIFAKRELPAIGIATSSGKNNEDGGDADDADDSEGEVGSGEVGPGGDGRHCWLVVSGCLTLGSQPLLKVWRHRPPEGRYHGCKGCKESHGPCQFCGSGPRIDF